MAGDNETCYKFTPPPPPLGAAMYKVNAFHKAEQFCIGLGWAYNVSSVRPIFHLCRYSICWLAFLPITKQLGFLDIDASIYFLIFELKPIYRVIYCILCKLHDFRLFRKFEGNAVYRVALSWGRFIQGTLRGRDLMYSYVQSHWSSSH